MIVAHVRGHRVKAEGLDEHASASWMTKVDSRAKVAGVLTFAVVCALLTDTRLVVAALLISVVFAAMSQVPPRHLAKAYMGALPFMLIASLSVFLFAGSQNGLEMLARTSACVLALLVLASGTETYDLFSGLRRLRVPTLVVTLLMLTYKYILVMSEELSRMTTARKARGFKGGRSVADMRGLRILSYTAGMVFVRSSARAERGYDALRSRGFSKEFPNPREKAFSTAEAAFLAWFLSVSVLLAALQLGVSA